MNHEQAERLLSARIDGERLSSRQTVALEHHLESCAECRAFERGAYRLREAARFEVAPAVPDLVDEVMAAVGAEPTRPRLRVVRPAGRSRPRLLPRLAPIAAALLVGALFGSLLVGGPWHRSETGSALAASEVAEGIAAAAVHLDAYQATFEIRESNASPDVPRSQLTMRVWFRAPERFRLDVLDDTDYPTKTTRTNLRLVVNGSRWYAAGPAPCPTAVCPQRESVVRNRLPFSTARSMPTDLVLPISTLADADRLTVLGRGTVLGRPAVEVEVPFERAHALFPFAFLSTGGDWRPFFPNDRVRIWLDERNWFPLKWAVYPATGAERDAWALRFGLPDEPSLRPVFTVTATDVSTRTPGPGVFRIPATTSSTNQGGRSVGLNDVVRDVGFEPVAPATVGGLDRYRVVVPTDDTARSLIAYTDGLAFVNLGETRTWSGNAPFGPVGVQAEEVPLVGGGIAYYEPSTDVHGRRVSIHAAGTDLYLETNLPRADLLAAAASLPVEGLPMPEAWRFQRVGDATLERVSLQTARASVPFPVEIPATLPDGFGLASVELVEAGYGPGVTLYFRDRDADAGIGTIRLHVEPAQTLPPATSAAQVSVDVGDAHGRFTPGRSELEWIRSGVYHSLDAPGLELPELVAIGASTGSGLSG